MGTTSPDLVRQAITAHIARLAVDTSQLSSTTAGYAHATTDTWREAEEPLVPEVEPSPRAHLAFFVDDRDLDDTLRSRSTTDDEPVVKAALVVRFLARMRPGANRKPDWDRAGRAARTLFAHLIPDMAWEPEMLIQRPSSGQILRRFPVGDGEFLGVEVRVDVLYQLSLAP